MAKTTLFGRKQSGGAFTVVDESITTGNIFFVDSGKTTDGADSVSKGNNPDAPFLTIAYAITQCTASNGDIIYVMPGHTETATITTGIALSTAGITIRGQGYGRARPTITCHASTIDAITVTGASCRIENLLFKGAASSTSFIDIQAADVEVYNCIFEHTSVPLDGIIIGTGGHRFKITDCTFCATADGPNVAIDIQGGSLTGPWEISRNVFNYAPNGLDDGAIVANAKAVPGGLVRDNIIIGTDGIAIDFNSSSTAVGDGMMVGNRISAGTMDNIDGLIDAGGYILIDNYGSDKASEGGGLIPVTTPA